MAGLMNEFKRGDVVLVNLKPVIGSEQCGKSRPGLVVSPDALNGVFRGIIVLPITDAQHLKQSELGLTFLPAGEGGLNKDSLAIAFQVRMIDKGRVIRRLGNISKEFMLEITDSLKAVLDIP